MNRYIFSAVIFSKYRGGDCHDGHLFVDILDLFLEVSSRNYFPCFS